jgi:DNA polymerase V
MKPRAFALLDCNNFYASCEQLFRPELRGRPLVVLGNNDGCVVARSREAKALGVPMGAPYFQIRTAFEQQGGVAFSSNYTLYGDLSRRVMETLREFTGRVEVYSIDEAFLELDDAPRTLLALVRQIRATVTRWTGLPVSIGLGPTKTLAKLANKVAKQGEGTCDLVNHADRGGVLKTMPVEEVWGIGPQYRRLLQTHGIGNAFQLSRVDEQWARRRLTVMGLRTVLELRGVACFGLEELPPAKKAIGRARQFGRRLTELEELYEPLASYVASAGRELRKQHLVAGALRVSLETSQHEEPVYANSVFRLLPWPTAHTGELIQWACQALTQIWKPDYLYRRCGVLLTELAPETQQQTSLFATASYDPRKQTLMHTVDHLNAEWGQGALRHAREGVAQTWRMRQGRRSPHYTTRWEELLVIAA